MAVRAPGMGLHDLVIRDAAEQEFGATKVRGRDTTMELSPASRTLRSCICSARIALLGPQKTQDRGDRHDVAPSDP